MKVTLFCPELLESDGGIQRILRLYLRALAADPAHEAVNVVAFNDAMLPEERMRELACAKPGGYAACNRGRLRFLRAAWRLTAGVDRVVCGHVRQLPVAALIQRIRPSLKIYLVAHGIEVWRPFTPAELRALHRCTRIWCVSDFTRRQIARQEPSLAKLLTVVPNALDPVFAVNPPEAVRTDGARVILSIGRLSLADAYKGYDLLIRALPRIRAAETGVRLRFIGTGDDETRLKLLATECGVGSAVEFPGRVSDEQLRLELARCALFALPSTGEGFGLVYIEALAAGKPCVGVRAGATPEIINRACGRLAEPGDIESIAAMCIETLRENWSPESLRHQAQRHSFAAFQARLATAW